MLGDGVLKRLVNFAQAVLQNVAEANQDRQGDAAQLELIDQFLQIDRAVGVFIRVDAYMAVGTDGEIALAPTGDVVKFRRFGDGPAVGGLANRRGFIVTSQWT